MAYILSIGTQSPDYCFQQADIAESLVQGLNLPPEQAINLRKLYSNSSIDTRYSVLQELDCLCRVPTSKERNDIYKEEAPKLAIMAAKKALSGWKNSPSAITHLISISCTGMMAPGIEYHLLKELKLNPSISRLGINFMGCFGAFNGLTVAKAIVKENPNHRVLMVCTELCTLHGQVDESLDSMLANALFADGAAACIIGGDPAEDYLWKIEDRASLILEDSDNEMSWDIGDAGFIMKLSKRVPVLIKKNIDSFTRHLIKGKCSFEESLWAIHPGGKSIINAIETACNLSPSQTSSSWDVLKRYGNMSSATFLFVLENSLKAKSKWTIGIGFGPGLSFEGILLKAKDVL